MGQSENLVMKSIVNKKIHQLADHISPPWLVLIKGMLRKNPRNRWNILRVSDHLFKHRFDDEALLTDDSDDFM